MQLPTTAFLLLRCLASVVLLSASRSFASPISAAAPLPSNVSSIGTAAAAALSSTSTLSSVPPARSRLLPPSPSHLSPELKVRDPDALALALAEPQETCANSGVGNAGCNNSGINNSGTSNSGVSNCGTGLSGVGEGCSGDDNDGSRATTPTYSFAGITTTTAGGTFVVAAAGVTGYTTTLTGPTSTVTIVGDGRNRRTDCAYWRSQGYVCSGAAAGTIRGGGDVWYLRMVAGVAFAASVWLVVC